MHFSKGLLFCPTPTEIDVYTLRKDVLNYVGRSRLKEYFYSDEESDGDFSMIPAFRRKKSSQCLDKNRDFFLEVYASTLKEKIFQESNLKAKCHQNLTKEEQKAGEDFRSYDDIVIKQASAVARPNGQLRQAGVARGVRGHAPPPPRNFEL